MWIKVHYTGIIKIAVLESSNFKTIDKKKYIILKDFGKVKMIKTPAGFDLVT